ncbi:hypothetical protein MKZ38_002300 [Zalerion maritima]|uniref:Uncharacterized protein n=1 Tax=Zalerion maritima TaxID=339359 RepID=A0AAD5RQ29_9PEZI|nr:hypothetical protein MKZ38_002300 [Zalerion maritima]
MYQRLELTVTTHPGFNANTEGVKLAKACADGVRGVDCGGLGYSAEDAFESISALKASYGSTRRIQWTIPQKPVEEG